MQSKLNWLVDINGHFVKVERGYLATIALNTAGEATLTLTYPGPSANGDNAPVSQPKAFPTPNPNTYPTIKYAKQAFRVYLRDVSVTA